MNCARRSPNIVGSRCFKCKLGQARGLHKRERRRHDEKTADAFARYRRQRGAKSSAVAADTMSSASPSFSPAALTDCKPGTCEGVLGFQSTPTRVACGTT
jgi:hypothetical protein